MKSSIVLLISLVHLLLSFSSYSCFTTTPNQLLQVVRDTKGEIVTSNNRYFVVSALIGVEFEVVRRGFTINEAGDAKCECPIEVIESPLDWSMPVYFKPKARKQEEIIESTDVNIEFYSTICKDNVWMVDGYPGPESPMFLSTNGVAGKPDSWFQIKKVNNYRYKLAFCPHKERNCSDIGIKAVDGQKRLAIRTHNTFYVMFIKDTYIGLNSII